MKKILNMVGFWYIDISLQLCVRTRSEVVMPGNIFIYPAEAELIIAAATLRSDWHA